MNIATETKVGLLVIAAAIALAWLTFQSGTLSKSEFGQDTRILKTEFENVDGITIGSKIKVAGVQVGEVIDIKLDKNGTASLKMAIKDDVPLAQNVKAQIASSGIIGEKFIALITEFGAKGTLAENQVKIPSIGAASADDIAQNFGQVSDDLKQITSALRNALGGAENAKKLERIVDSIDGVGQKLSKILDAEGQDTGKMLADFTKTAENLSKITSRIEKGEGMLGQMLSSDSQESDLVADLKATMRELRQVADKVNKGEGTLGRLVNDPTTVDKIENALDSLSNATARMEAFRTEVDFHGYSLPAEEVAKGRFNITFAPRPTRYYVLGVTSDGMAYAADSTTDDPNPSLVGQDFGDDLKYTLQFGHVYEGALMGKNLGFRVGLKDSSFGIGLDTRTTLYDRMLALSTDLYAFSGANSGVEDNPHLDFTAKYNLLADSNTLYAIGGYDNALSQEYGSPFVGLGFRFQDDDLKYMLGQAL